MAVPPASNGTEPIDCPSQWEPDLVLMLDYQRRAARQNLIALLNGLIAEAQILTTAALRSDWVGVAHATDLLDEMAASPTLDLSRTTEIYNSLRQAVADSRRSPGSASAGPDQAPAAHRAPRIPTRHDIRWPSPA